MKENGMPKFQKERKSGKSLLFKNLYTYNRSAKDNDAKINQ